ncbi:hypothetical protein [Pluralibacter gergoviae]|uniref:hypothetical protein n=1 Tax=Pluralibacter gergoviae TaxID=61647 RepID=UPI00093D0955|nr:hypothetical protein [Pluralibacter gergoviae]
MNEWKYTDGWSEEELLNGSYCGFVYSFYFPNSDQYYYGAKQLYKRVKDAKKIKEDSTSNGWENYTSSSKTVNQMINDGEPYIRTVLYGFPTMRETLLVESIIITTQILKPECLNMAVMNKLRAPNSQTKARLLAIVQEILEWIN